MNTLIRTAEFDSWLKAVRDRVAKARIAQRLDAVVAGHFGDCEPVGEGVSEMRIHVGAGHLSAAACTSLVRVNSCICFYAAAIRRASGATSSAPSRC